jgi:hypothetical protein
VLSAVNSTAVSKIVSFFIFLDFMFINKIVLVINKKKEAKKKKYTLYKKSKHSLGINSRLLTADCRLQFSNHYPLLKNRLHPVFTELWQVKPNFLPSVYFTPKPRYLS